MGHIPQFCCSKGESKACIERFSALLHELQLPSGSCYRYYSQKNRSCRWGGAGSIAKLDGLPDRQWNGVLSKDAHWNHQPKVYVRSTEGHSHSQRKAILPLLPRVKTARETVFDTFIQITTGEFRSEIRGKHWDDAGLFWEQSFRCWFLLIDSTVSFRERNVCCVSRIASDRGSLVFGSSHAESMARVLTYCFRFSNQ